MREPAQVLEEGDEGAVYCRVCTGYGCSRCDALPSEDGRRCHVCSGFGVEMWCTSWPVGTAVRDAADPSRMGTIVKRGGRLWVSRDKLPMVRWHGKIDAEPTPWERLVPGTVAPCEHDFQPNGDPAARCARCGLPWSPALEEPRESIERLREITAEVGRLNDRIHGERQPKEPREADELVEALRDIGVERLEDGWTVPIGDDGQEAPTAKKALRLLLDTCELEGRAKERAAREGGTVERHALAIFEGEPAKSEGLVLSREEAETLRTLVRIFRSRTPPYKALLESITATLDAFLSDTEGGE